MRKALVAAALVLAGLGAGAVGRATAGEREPGAVEHHPGHWVVTGAECATEDSCTVDYNAGEWSIEEVTP